VRQRKRNNIETMKHLPDQYLANAARHVNKAVPSALGFVEF
jgi:hypothetical protein